MALQSPHLSHSPYSAILRTFFLRPALARDNRESAIRHWHQFEKSQFWPRQQLLDYQWQKLTELLRHAYDTCPYYRRTFDERGMTPDSFKDFSDLEKLPILTRDTILTEGNNLVSSMYDPESLMWFSTGGTTGVRTDLYRDYESYNIKLGIQWRHEGWAGRRPCDKVLLVWLASVDYPGDYTWKSHIKNLWLLRQAQYFIGAGTDREMAEVYEKSRNFDAPYLKVFPSALESLTDYMQRKNLPRLYYKTILSTGEPLHERQRRLFSDFFQAEVFDMYGSREVGNTASESPAHDGLLIAMETSFVEFLDPDGKPVPYGEPGEMVITDLTNYGMPLIRYGIQDQGMPLDGNSSCGRELQRMSSAIGRDTDDIWTAEGVRLSGYAVAFSLTDDGPKVGQVQVIQKSLHECDVKVLDRPTPTPEIVDYLTSTLKRLIGPETVINMEVVDHIPREKSGKVRSIINRMDDQTRENLATMNGERG